MTCIAALVALAVQDHAAVLKAVVEEVDHLKRHLMVIARESPDLLADLRKQRPDLAGVLDDIEKRVRSLDEEMKKLAAALESDDLETRSAAGDKIAALGPVAAPYLRALAKSEHAEVRAQAQALLGRLEPRSPARDKGAMVRLEIFDTADFADAAIETINQVIEFRDDESVVKNKSGFLIIRARKETCGRVRALIAALRAAKK